jgi:tetraacyldisaccharide 4'-kinase
MNPLSAIFGAGVALRNTLYDRRVFKVSKLTRPVVSVGNLSVGGSGKTPFVIALGQLLKSRGIAFDVLSRGYGRSATNVTVVDPSGPPERFGDEPLLIARKLQVPVIVGADRYRAGLLAEKEFPSRLHLLDDGFQHRRLHRDFDIVLLPAADLTGTLLPVGRLREPLSALRRADAVAATTSSDAAELANKAWKIRRDLYLDLSSQRAVAFCGIARPAQFFAQLREAGVELADTASFPDHHRYSASDADRLLRLRSSSGAEVLITTEKDLINLGPLADGLQPLQIAELRIVLTYAEAALSTLFSTLEGRSGCRF